jgi:hypothetical protein
MTASWLWQEVVWPSWLSLASAPFILTGYVLLGRKRRAGWWFVIASQAGLLAIALTNRQYGLVVVVVLIEANRARLALSGRTDELARARVPRRAGGWLLLHASLVDDDPGGRVGVILQAATTPEIAPLIAEAHGLSRREREVTRMVLYGLSTREIADGLGITPYTV